jgi:predicted AlkP superfamily pyrophosphatase or phosphodiesterase
MRINRTLHVRHSLFFVLLISALVLNFAPLISSQPAQPQARRVIVISLDGLDVRYLQKRDEYGLKIPTLRRLLNDGVMAQVTGVYPSVTYPSHTSIVTGVNVARHGIYGNEVFEAPDAPQTGRWYWYARDIRAETLWDAAAKSKLTTALISWPVSAGAGDYNFPEIWKPGGTREETGVVIKQTARPAGLVEEVEKRDANLYRNLNKDEGDDMRTRLAEYVISEKRPHLTLIHLFDLDHFEHDYGPFTPEAFSMLEKVDGYVARILDAARRAGTLNETAIFIVSDHGFSPVSKRIHPGVILARAGLQDIVKGKDWQGQEREIAKHWLAASHISGGSCAIILRDAKDDDTRRKVLAAFNEFAQGEGRGSLRVLSDAEVRRLETNPQAAIILEASEGYYFTAGYTGASITAAKLRGQHGYLPSRYYTTFIASGAGIGRRGSLGTIRLIDEGPTIARTLNLKLRDAQGRTLSLK